MPRMIDAERVRLPEDLTDNEKERLLTAIISQPTATWKREDFTDDELRVLKLAFSLVDTVVENQSKYTYDNDMSNGLYSLKEKLGLWEVLDEE